MKVKKLLIALCIGGILAAPISAGSRLSNYECDALEFAIDDAATSGQSTLADALFSVYVKSDCWPFAE